MSNIQTLAGELTNDPLAIGYSAMTNAEIVASINTANRGSNRDSIPTNEILEAIDSSALLALTGDKAVRVWGILAMDSVDPFGVAASILVDAFGGGSATITALAALRVEQISRANELGYSGKVREGHVELAKAGV